MSRLNVNIDHVATVRQARRAPEPSVVAAAMICEQAGADGITTEGGLDAKANIAIVRATVARLREANILASLFIDPDPVQIEVAHEVGAQQVELCTAAYADAMLGARGIHGEGAV